ncbi:MAG: hypothetical protein EA350_01155 [Gemmatimonadales bacterium]|nr:MAG: hypothetical protein EA350_01155 [Gemmatimonadales bacterium]
MSEIQPRVPLESLDPATREPEYWARFHDAVLRAASPELARRRAMPLTISGVLLSWSRALVPGAAAAAAIAGILLVPLADGDDSSLLFGVEDILREEAVRADLAPAFLASDASPEDAFLVSVERLPSGPPSGGRP